MHWIIKINIIIIIFIIFSSLTNSFSSLLSPYAAHAWPVILGASLLAVLLSRVRRGWGTSGRRLLQLLGLNALLAAGITQVIAANDLPSGLLPLNELPAQAFIYLTLGAVAAFTLTWLTLMEDPQWVHGGPALAAAGIYSSVAFFRVSAVPETGHTYSLLAGFALLAILDNSIDFHCVTPRERLYWKASIPFLLILALATLVSPVPGESLAYTIELLILVVLAGILSISIRRWDEWQMVAGWILLLAGGLPIILGLVKLVDVIFHLGFPAAISYRLHPTEMGGANLIARSILTVAPLALALWVWMGRMPRKKPIRLGLLALQVLILLILLWARSWEGFFAWLAALGIFLILWLWPNLAEGWRRLSSRPLLKWVAVGAGFVLIISLASYSVQLATKLNAMSYNGRVTHWKSALVAMIANPFLGGGPGNEYLLSNDKDVLLPIERTKEIEDEPLFVIAYRSSVTKVHAHNLLLEIGAFTGVGGVLTFTGSVLVLLWIGFQSWKHGDTRQKLFAAACLAGITGELAWGMLDVLRAAPPFFSSPIWVLTGLLLALPRANRLDSLGRATPSPIYENKIPEWIALAGAIFFILIPSLASNQYASGFLAYQQHRWQEAGERLQWATWLDPLSAHYRQMLGSVNIEIGQLDDAAEALEAALNLKRGFSPYLMDAARLAWLQGNIPGASSFYEQAIESDPLEVWSSGSYAELALLKAFQGDRTPVVDHLKQSLELHPEFD